MTAPTPAPFDTAAVTYDATFTDTALGRRLRAIAWRWLDDAFGPGDHVLELGCGTGADAAHLASRGVTVVATDISEGMLEIARRQMVVRDVNDLVRVARLDLDTVGLPGWEDGLHDPYDGVYSDFGALNCVAERSRLLRGLAQVLLPGGRLVIVVMGPLCPWEVGWHLLHGEPRLAGRRWRAGATAAVGDGRGVRVWYPSQDRVAREAAPWFTVERTGGIGVALPPSGLSLGMAQRGWLLRTAAPVERQLGPTRLGSRLGDHWVMTLRRRDG